MCGRFTLAGATADELRARFPLGESAVDLRPRYNVAPGDDVVTIAMRDGRPAARMVRWGFVPPWARDPSVGFRMINARAETVAEKPAYRAAFARRRCLIVADGFYEWRRAEGASQPYHVTRRDGAPFAFAGLWTGWKDPETDRWLRTCTIVTTRANEALAAIHPRMPVILDPDAEMAWLDPATPLADAHALLRPLPAELTRARAVSRAVNDARYDGAACLDDAPPDQLRAFEEAERAAAASPLQPGLF